MITNDNGNTAWDIGDAEEWQDAEIEEIIEDNENMIFEQDDLIDQIESATESIKVDFVQEDVEEEILHLSEYVSTESNNSLSVVAEYTDINVVNIDNKSKKTAQDLVRKITKFIIEFDDVELNENHKKYLNEVGSLEISTLQDLLTITQYNKQMIDNIVLRINSVQAEDFAMIQSYTSLVNNHMRLMKDLQAKYKAIPSIIKRMKAEILCNQELGKDENNYKRLEQEIENTVEISSNKDMIRQLRMKREEELNKK